MVGIADEPARAMAALGQQAQEMLGHLAMPACDDDVHEGFIPLKPSPCFLDICSMAGPAWPWPNDPAMPYYHCPSCSENFHTPRQEPFEWCKCGQVLDCTSALDVLEAIEARGEATAPGSAGARRRRFERHAQPPEPAAA